MKRAFLYIDILGFENLVTTNPSKINQIFSIIDNLTIYKRFNLQVIVFSDTILVFTKNESLKINYYANYLHEYTQDLFYKLTSINVYFKAVLTFGEFNFSKMKNIEAYFGLALIKTYRSSTALEGFGLYIDKEISDWIWGMNTVEFSEEYDYVFLCKSIKELYLLTDGILPVKIELLQEMDDYSRVDEDLRFFREIEYLKENHPMERVRIKYQKVYDTYKSAIPLFFKVFETEGFMPFAINPEYTGKINSFDLLSKIELNGS